MKHYVTIEDPQGVVQTIDYGEIEWKGASAKVSNPEVGVLLISGPPSTPSK